MLEYIFVEVSDFNFRDLTLADRFPERLGYV
jgi:hypothetical protein